ncbi:MAG: InlB B-repeat-containing protein, partial [Ruthenibacterium sp.]
MKQSKSHPRLPHRVLCLALSMLMICSLLPVSVFAEAPAAVPAAGVTFRYAGGEDIRANVPVTADSPALCGEPAASEDFHALLRANASAAYLLQTKDASGASVPDLDPAHYTFAFDGWYTQPQNQPEAALVSAGTLPAQTAVSYDAAVAAGLNAQGLIVYAHYSVKAKLAPCSVSYQIGTVIYAAQSYAQGDAIVLPTAPSAENGALTAAQSFLGWDGYAEGMTASEPNLILTAKLGSAPAAPAALAAPAAQSGAKITVTYFLNGASGTVPAPETLALGTSLSMPDQGAMTLPGRQFIGWSENAQNIVPQSSGYLYQMYAPGESFTPQRSTKLYAIWAEHNTDASFFIRLDGHIPDEPSNYPATSYTGGIFIKGVLTLSKNVCDTSGARVAANLNFQPTKEQIAAVCKASNVTYNPDTQSVLWYVIKAADTWHVDGVLKYNADVTLTYERNCARDELTGEVPLGGVHHAGETLAVESIGSAKRGGYDFVGWNTASDGSGTAYKAGDKIALTGNMVLYAQWTPNSDTLYTIEYYLQNSNGTWPASVAVDKTQKMSGITDTTVSLPSPLKSFAGYVYDATNPRNISSVKVLANGSAVLKCYYQRQYTAQFYNDDKKTLLDESQYVHGATLVPPAVNPQKADDGQHRYTFDGWYTKDGKKLAASVLVVSDLTYYARYTSTAIDYPVHFIDYNGKDLGSTV